MELSGQHQIAAALLLDRTPWPTDLECALGWRLKWALAMHIIVFWDVTPCSLVGTYRFFREDVSSTVNTQAAGSAGMSVHVYQNRRHLLQKHLYFRSNTTDNL
jgi:hypothetical protein